MGLSIMQLSSETLAAMKSGGYVVAAKTGMNRKVPLSDFASASDIVIIGADIAPAYSSSQTYAKDDLVMYAGQLYVCVQDISVAESFNTQHWSATSISNLLKEQNPMYKYIKTDALASYKLKGDAATATVQPTTKTLVLTRLDNGTGGTNYINKNYGLKIRKAKIDMGGTGSLLARTAIAGELSIDVIIPSAFSSSGSDVVLDSFKITMESWETFEDKTIVVGASSTGWASAYQNSKPAALRVNSTGSTLYISDFNVQDVFVEETLSIFLTLGVEAEKFVGSDGTTVID